MTTPDLLENRLANVSDRLQTIADERVGIDVAQSIESNITRIEKALCEAQARAENLRSERDNLAMANTKLLEENRALRRTEPGPAGAKSGLTIMSARGARKGWRCRHS